jgi:ABC-type uncharacterized transport system substrate-binding protein
MASKPMISRRSLLLALPATLAHATTSSRRIAIVFPSALEPCAEAVEGLRVRLSEGDFSVDLLDVSKAGFTTEVAQEIARKPAVIVAVGSDAVRALPAQSSLSITVSTMTLQADHAAAQAAGKAHTAVYLDVPVCVLFAELRKLFPYKTRVGIIRSPSRGDPSGAQLRGQGPEMNALQVADCAAPDELLPTFLSLRKKVDFVICLPDGSLYNGATARPLIMASLENRLPIVGFSPAFLRAGAAVAIYPDYRGIGQQTADLVRRCLEPGDCAGSEGPKKVNVAVNAKILRMLGIEFAAASHPDVVILR